MRRPLTTPHALAASLAALVAACSLNPQPEPPGDDVVPSQGSSNGGTSASGGKSSGEPGGTKVAGGQGGATQQGPGGGASTETGGNGAFPMPGGVGGSVAGQGGEQGQTNAGVGGSSGMSSSFGGAMPPAAGAGGASAGAGGAIASTAGGQAGTAGQVGDGGAGGGEIGAAGAAGASGGASQCTPVVAAPDGDPWMVRAPGIGFGAIVPQSSGGHSDVFLESPSQGATPQGYTRVGVRLDWGGSLVFFGLGADPLSNVIDANDTGRNIQLAVYDPTRIRQGCAHDASCLQALTCEPSITYLGWNPVQGGDECNHGAEVIEQGQAGDALRVRVKPMQWNPDWDRPDCASSPCGASGVPVEVTYTIELRYLTPHVVELMTEVQSHEAISHPETEQEFPTFYASFGQGGPDLPLLLDADGNAPPIDQPANDGFFYGPFTSSAPLVVFQNADRTYGAGLAMDQGITAFGAWRGDGKSGPYFHNVRAKIHFGLTSGGMVRGLSYLSLGSFETARQELASVLAARPAFGVVDVPAQGAVGKAKADGAVTIEGWVLDGAPIDHVRVEIDGVEAAKVQPSLDRPDVCAVYPGYATCPKAGFTAQVASPLLDDGCAHLARIIARDANGNESTLGERVVSR